MICVWLHFVKLISAGDATVCEHKCVALYMELTHCWVFVDVAVRPAAEEPLSLVYTEMEAVCSTNLRNRGLAVGGVAHQQDVDVAPQDGFFGQVLLGSRRACTLLSS